MRFVRDAKGSLLAVLCVFLSVFLCNRPACAQDAEPGWEKQAGGKQQFEAASVRENKSGEESSSNFMLDGNGNAYWVMTPQIKVAPEGSLFRATNQTLLRYIIFAYRLSGPAELALRLRYWSGLEVNVPAWVSDTRYDIEARSASASTKDQMRLMMQSLLTERFKLTAHKEVRQAPVFALELERPSVTGPQLNLHPASDTCATTEFPGAKGIGMGKALPIPCGIIARLPPSVSGRQKIGGRNVTLAMLAESLPAGRIYNLTRRSKTVRFGRREL